MNTRKDDPIFESLDRLAGLADADLVGDRMPDIQRRVRVSRQRKSACLVAAVAVLAVGAVGVWHGLPIDHAAPPVHHTRTTPSQQITVDAQAQGAADVRIGFTVTGRSTEYVDLVTGKPVDYAGPRSTTVLVDGRVVSGSNRGAISCRPGGALTPYTLEFHRDKPLVVPVSAGEHQVVVKAPYCADGDLVDSTETVVVTTRAAGFTTFDKLAVDLDGDGTDDVVRVLVPKDVNGEQRLEVTWGTGETTSAGFPNTMDTSLRDPADLDSDGDLELVLLGGGGDVSVGSVFLADPASLQQVKTVDAAGHPLSLRTDADPASWQTYLGADGVFSYRLTNPADTQPPFPVEVRAWTLDGDTLTQAAKSTAECVDFQQMTLGPC